MVGAILDTTFKRWYFDSVTVHRIYAATRTNQRRWAMPKPTEAALRKLRRKFGNAQTAGRVSGKARFGWKVIKAPGKVRPPYRLYPVDERNGKDLTPQVGGVGFTPTPRQKVIRRASRVHVESPTLAQIDRALIIWNGNLARAAKSLGISPSRLARLRKELLAQQVAEQHATVPSPALTPPAPTMAADPDDEELAADDRRIKAGLARQAAGASADVHPVPGSDADHGNTGGFRKNPPTPDPISRGSIHAFDLPAEPGRHFITPTPEPSPRASALAHDPVTGELLEPSTPPDLGPDSDEESEPVATDDPPPPPPSSGGCNDKV